MPGSKTYFTSDTHAFHANIMLYCARTRFMTENDKDKFENLYVKQGQRFKLSQDSVNNMNEGIVKEINDRVTSKDDLICCGDWVFGSRRDYYENAKWLRDRLNARNVDLIIGNHDIPSLIRDLFRYCVPVASWNVEGQDFALSHYPMLTWNRSHHGVIHIFGHVHNLYNKATAVHPLVRPELWCAFDVGVDTNDFQPYSVDDLVAKAKVVWDAQKKARKENSEHHLF